MFVTAIFHAGTFNSHEKSSCLKNFVREQLQSDWLPFILSEPGGGTLTQEESSFEELGLVSGGNMEIFLFASLPGAVKLRFLSCSVLKFVETFLENPEKVLDFILN